MWRNIEGLGPHVNFLVHVDTGQDEEHPGAPRAPGQQQPEPEYHRPLVFLTRTRAFRENSENKFSSDLSGHTSLDSIEFNWVFGDFCTQMDKKMVCLYDNIMTSSEIHCQCVVFVCVMN